jgi:hypothetical protein
MYLTSKILALLNSPALESIDNRRLKKVSMKETEIQIKSCNDCPYYRPDDYYSYCKFYEKQIDMYNLVDKPDFCWVTKIIVVEE